MNPVTILAEWWELIVLIASGVGGLFAWRARQRSANTLLLNEYEELKKRIVILIKQEVTHAETLAEAHRFLRSMEAICPECYQRAIDEITNNNDANSKKA